MELLKFRVYIDKYLYFTTLLTVSQVDVHLYALVVKLPTYKI